MQLSGKGIDVTKKLNSKLGYTYSWVSFDFFTLYIGHMNCNTSK